jgi:hypothetical protein
MKQTNLHFWSCLAQLFLKWEMLQTKGVEKMKKTHFRFLNFFYHKSFRLWNNVEKCEMNRGRPQMAIRRMRIAFWVPKVTNTHSEYVILIAFPQKQWLHERATIVTSHVRRVLAAVTLQWAVLLSVWYRQYLYGPDSVTPSISVWAGQCDTVSICMGRTVWHRQYLYWPDTRSFCYVITSPTEPAILRWPWCCAHVADIVSTFEVQRLSLGTKCAYWHVLWNHICLVLTSTLIQLPTDKVSVPANPVQPSQLIHFTSRRNFIL